jgi:hypothetical protein
LKRARQPSFCFAWERGRLGEVSVLMSDLSISFVSDGSFTVDSDGSFTFVSEVSFTA